MIRLAKINFSQTGLTTARTVFGVLYHARMSAILLAGGLDFKKYLKQVHVRPFVVLMLLDFLIDRKHEVFSAKGSESLLKAQMREAMAREYPETEAHLPEEKRQGSMPSSIEDAMREFAEADDASHSGSAPGGSRNTSAPGGARDDGRAGHAGSLRAARGPRGSGAGRRRTAVGS